jgi:plastocyanin
MSVRAHTHKRWRLAFAAIAFSAMTVSPAFAGEVIKIKVKNLVFEPAQVTAHVGDSIEWINEDFIAHTATARNKDWDVNIPANGSGRMIIQHAGKVEYYCRFHPNMIGSLTVE